MGCTINEDCVNCPGYLDVCPMGAVPEGTGRSRIDPEKCTDCGICRMSIPVRRRPSSGLKMSGTRWEKLRGAVKVRGGAKLQTVLQAG